MGILNGKFETEEVSFSGNEAGPLFVTPFHTSHDARESCGYKIDCSDGRKISIATDLGEMTEEVFSAVSGSDLVMLESNHDVMMLENGPYPYSLKKRILGKKGHLSNDACASTAERLVNGGTTRIYLGHLVAKTICRLSHIKLRARHLPWREQKRTATIYSRLQSPSATRKR